MHGHMNVKFIIGESKWKMKQLISIKQMGLSDDTMQKIIQLNIQLKNKQKKTLESES